ncbi:MAG: formimidoylglutamate deiminase [Burkholderiales bacterium]|nr:formimidoylglutamate deiminase [Burkholderiales bacterium]
MTVLHAGQALLPEGWATNVRVTLAGGCIASVESGATPRSSDERHAILLPGSASLHSHAFQRGMAGLAERRGPATDTFWTWRELMYRFALALTPEENEAVAAWLYAEMLETGFTRVGEFHYLHHAPDGRPYDDIGEMASRIAAAAAETGIGLTLLPVFYAHSTFGGAPPGPGQRRFICDVDLFARLVERSRAAASAVPGATFGVAPHSLRAVTPGELVAVVPMAAGGPVHMHAAEQVREVEDCLAWSGRRPVEWLLDEAGLDARWCLIHATHMSPSETQGLAARGTVAGLCPVTEANLGDGTFPTRDYLSAGGRIGVGTDSNVLVGVAAELRQLEYAQRLARRERNVLADGEGAATGATLFRAALAGGAAALAAGPAAIAPGASADLVSLDADHPALVGRAGDALIDGWVFAARDNPVDCVWARGTKQVEGGRHRLRERLLPGFRRAVERILAA